MPTLLCPPSGATMELTVLSDNGELVRCRIEGRMAYRIDTADDEPLAAAIGFGAYGRNVLLGLSDVSALDTSGVSWLIATHKRLDQGGGRLVLHSLSHVARNVVRVLSLGTVLTIVETEQDAENLVAGDIQ